METSFTFTLMTNEPISFTLTSSTTGSRAFETNTQQEQTPHSPSQQTQD